MKDKKMTWEETIQYIRTKPEYNFLVEKAYFEEDLKLNVERFKNDTEFGETLKLIKQFAPNAKSILDIGCGNGISTISFALKNYEVTAVEPDPSSTIGAGAIRKLITEYNLSNVKVFEDFAENINFENNSFDIVYVRQAMHHAHDLKKFIYECSRVLKPGGLLLTIRDHVIYNDQDKEWFLENHPLQKYYGGENAFTSAQYKAAMIEAGLQIVKEIKYYDNKINYFPTTDFEVEKEKKRILENYFKILEIKIGSIAKLALIKNIYMQYLKFKKVQFLNEENISGRMYSYVSLK
jgi:ubiquinone/menaquinone biosynthesis C-methylase UbiE